MKNTTLLLIKIVCLFITVNSGFAQSTQFTYQGHLNDGANPANGIYDLQFAIYDLPANPDVLIAGPLTNSSTVVSNGLFTVALDFGNAFPGADRYMEIAVRTNGTLAFTTLAPRQKLTPSPYAITAGSVVSGGLAGTYSNPVTFGNGADSFSGTFAGNGVGVSNVNASTLGGLTSANFWKTTGNSNTIPAVNFLGTADNQPVVIRANNFQVMQLAYASNAGSGYSPNVIGGHSANTVAAGVVGATIGGGGQSISGTNAVTGDFGTVIGGRGNLAAGKYAIAGGEVAQATGFGSVAMGSFSTASGFLSTALGGSTATNDYATALGNSTATGRDSTAMGNSAASGFGSVAMGGSFAEGTYSFAAGKTAFAIHDGTFVWSDNTFSAFQSTKSNQFLIRATGGVGIGLNNPSAPLHVAKGTAGTITINPNSIAVFEKSDNAYVSILTPFVSESGILFGNNNGDPNDGTDAGIIYNNSFTGRGLQFRTQGNVTRMIIDSSGNVGIGTTLATNKLHVAGGITCTALVQTSDRNAKENFAPVSPAEVLAKVTELPISSWTYKEMRDGRHLGPMAQDFYAAFKLGGSDTTITAIDTEGVALAAIQGLNHKLQEESAAKDVEIAALKSRLEKLEQFLKPDKR